MTGANCQIWPVKDFSDPVGTTLALTPTERAASWVSLTWARNSISPPLAITNSEGVPAPTV